MVISFIVCILAFVMIGILSSAKNQYTHHDYLLAGNRTKPWLVSLSAVATNNSGYMFIGLIGYTYSVGLSAIWLMLGWICGDFIASFLIHKHLRIKTAKTQSLSFSELISKWHGTDYRYLRILCAMITIVFLGTYASAQLTAGSKALHVLFGWHYSSGAVIGAVMVMLYCFSGGIRASIWTDVAQSFIMLVAICLICFVSVTKIGSVTSFAKELYTISPSYMQLFPEATISSPILFILGWVFAGFGVVGQPHIMVRFMAMDNPQNMNKVRYYYYSWFTIFFALCICAGLAARLLLPEVNNFDAELALPTLAQQLLPAPLVGLVLAGLFAATMSTADSQILSCSAALTRDFKQNLPLWTAKLATVCVTLVALIIALIGTESVFNLVLISWSALACAFAPLLTVYALNQKPSQGIAISMVLIGLGSMLLWRHFALGSIIYEIAPGIMAGLFFYFLWALKKRIT